MGARASTAIAAAAAVIALVIVGCASSADPAASDEAAPTTGSRADTTPQPAGSSTDTADAFPVTVEHALGATTIDREPQRVVVLGDFADLDSVLALGVTPVAFGFTDAFGTGLAPWQLAAGAAEIDQFDAATEIDIEQVVAADPDVIIGMTYLAEPIFSQLSALAPTVAVPFDVTWQDQLAMIGAALGRGERVAELQSDVAAALAAGADRLAAHAGETIMVGSYYADSLYIQGEQSSVTNLLHELGLTVATTTDEQMDQQSLENIPSLAGAAIVISFATDAAATHAAQDNPLWQTLPAVAAGKYTALTGTEARAVSDGFNALSYQTVIDIVDDVVSTTAQGAGTPLP